jgi:hypothetical protein
MVGYVRAGLPLALAAPAAGVAERTVYRWLAHGRQSDRHHVLHRWLLAALEQARAEAEVDLVVAMRRAARRGSWKAAAWLLEREYPQRWGPPGKRVPRPSQCNEFID